MHTFVRRFLLYVIPVGLLLMAAKPTLAASDWCQYTPVKFWSLDCETKIGVPANRSGRFIYYSVSPFSTYKVYDKQTNVSLRRGKAGSLGKRETIFGLYGSWYSVIVSGAPSGWAYLSNT